MRPRYLKIEGLQSFKELQEIDFDKLGETGLFGIFGPTGSGKSTILDAITLGLYGNVQRANRGTQGIINSDAKSVKVSFEFDLLKENVRKTYRVERLYRKKKDAQNLAEAKMARLFEITPDGEIIMADKPVEVTEKVIALIGLELNDFTRSVVLPQNKFQEFLLLDKSKKRDMMERIFYLEDYGRKLTDKVNKRLAAVRNRLAHIEGAMSALGDISERALIESESQMKAAWEAKEKVSNELKLAEMQYTQAKEIWDLVNELHDIIKQEEEHRLRLTDINEKKELYEKAVRAEGLVDIIHQYRKMDKNLADTETQLDAVDKLLPELEKQLNKIQSEYDKVVEKNEKDIPAMIEQKGKLNSALEIKQEISIIEEKLKGLRDSYAEFSREAMKKDGEIAAKKREMENNHQNVVQYKQYIEKLRVDIDYRKQVQAGVKLEEELNQTKKDLGNHQQKYNELSDKIAVLDGELKKASEHRQQSQNMLDTLRVQLQKHENLKPEDRNKLMESERTYHDLKAVWEALKLKKADQDALNVKLTAVKKDIRLYQEKYKTAEQKKANLVDLLNTYREKAKQLQNQSVQNAAYRLAKGLKEGTPCPVCGAVHHPSPASEIQQEQIVEMEQHLKKTEEQLQETEKNCRLVENNCIKLHEQLKTLENQSVQLKNELLVKQDEYNRLMGKLPKDMQEMKLEQIAQALVHIKHENEKKLKAIEQWEKILEEIKKDITQQEQILSKQKIDESVKKAELEVNKANLVQQKEVLHQAVKRFEEKSKAYRASLEKLEIQSFSSKLEQINQNDREIEKKQKLIEKLQNTIENIRRNIERLTQERQQWLNKAAEVETEGKSLKEQLNDRTEKLKALTGENEIEEEIKKIDENIHALRQTKQQFFERLKEIKEQFDQMSMKKSTLENQKQIYYKNLIYEKQRLQIALEQRGFAHIDEAEKCLLSKEQQEQLNTEINEYENVQKKLENHKDMLQQKLQGRSLTEREWHKIHEAYLTKKQEKEDSISTYENTKSIYHSVKKNFDQWVELNKVRQTYNRQKEMLEQIQKLLKGNSFVEFISEERLRYIAKEASETLGVLTKYRYALELDTDNGFIIRDNANGGVHRMVSSLSGGETFLTSLSLALALSSQIQLKGQSPLEFFFLDEGFGTLDTKLLDTVMDALERLSTQKRVIGLISHVPELKNRIARRLIVEPPSAEGRGSRVKIEKA